MYFSDLVPAFEAKLIGTGIISETDNIPESINTIPREQVREIAEEFESGETSPLSSFTFL